MKEDETSDIHRIEQNNFFYYLLLLFNFLLKCIFSLHYTHSYQHIITNQFKRNSTAIACHH